MSSDVGQVTLGEWVKCAVCSIRSRDGPRHLACDFADRRERGRGYCSDHASSEGIPEIAAGDTGHERGCLEGLHHHTHRIAEAQRHGRNLEQTSQYGELAEQHAEGAVQERADGMFDRMPEAGQPAVAARVGEGERAVDDVRVTDPCPPLTWVLPPPA